MLPDLYTAINASIQYIWQFSHAWKAYDYFYSTLSHLVRSVYEGRLGGEFRDILRNLLLGQISQAYETAWTDDGNELPPPEYIRDASQAAVLHQFEFVDQFYRDIVDARVDGTAIEPLLVRVPLWANRYTEAYNDAVNLISAQSGGKLEWVYGDTQHCDTCLILHGTVAYATEWQASGIKPQNAPNDLLQCGGWRCQCKLQPTDRRRSPKALDTLMNIAVARGL